MRRIRAAAAEGLAAAKGRTKQPTRSSDDANTKRDAKRMLPKPARHQTSKVTYRD